MKKHLQETQFNRRQFLRQSACASLGLTGLVNSLAQMKLMTAAMANTSLTSDYKAVVCIYLFGGNDSTNMLFPIGDPTTDGLRNDYEAIRGDLALDRPTDTSTTINIIEPDECKAFDKHHSGIQYPMGVHPDAPELAEIFNDGDLAFVCNVGTLAEPIDSRDDYLNGLVDLPTQLFAHNHQATQWESSIAGQAFSSGWAGRVADLMHSSYNPASKVSMSISLDGLNSFQVGATDVSQYVLSGDGVVPLSGYGDDSYANAYLNSTDASGGYSDTVEGSRMKAFDTVMNLTKDHLIEEEQDATVRSARDKENVVGEALVAAATSGVDFDDLFLNADTSLGDQLKMVAKLIAGNSELGNQRQTFFVRVGGYDTHSYQADNQSAVLTELSNALHAFRSALKELNQYENVMTYTASDFSRTLSPNKEGDSAGSDHAWGGHSIVMGGSVKGGQLYGHYPPLKVGDQEGSIDSHTTRGRLIPDVSVDQYSAVLANWLGADSNSMDVLFPHLYRFDDPLTSSSANIDFTV